MVGNIDGDVVIVFDVCLFVGFEEFEVVGDFVYGIVLRKFRGLGNGGSVINWCGLLGNCVLEIVGLGFDQYVGLGLIFVYEWEFYYVYWDLFVVDVYVYLVQFIGWYVGECDVFVQCWGEGVGQDFVLVVGGEYCLVVVQYVFFVYYQVDQLVCVVCCFLCFQYFVVDEVVVFVQCYGLGQGGFVWGDLFVYVLVIQVYVGFQVQCVVCV